MVIIYIYFTKLISQTIIQLVCFVKTRSLQNLAFLHLFSALFRVFVAGLSVVEFANFANQRSETLVDVDVAESASLEEGDAVLLGELLTFSSRDFAHVIQIAFVTNENHWAFIEFFYVKNLVVELSLNLFKSRAGCNRVDEHEARAVAHVLIAHSRVFFLTRGIENVQQACFIIANDLLSVAIFDGGIVAVNKVIVDELNRDGTFANAA